MNMHVRCRISTLPVIMIMIVRVVMVMIVMLIVRMLVRMRCNACRISNGMLMRTTHFNRHQIHLPVTHAALGNQRL